MNCVNTYNKPKVWLVFFTAKVVLIAICYQSCPKRRTNMTKLQKFLQNLPILFNRKIYPRFIDDPNPIYLISKEESRKRILNLLLTVGVASSVILTILIHQMSRISNHQVMNKIPVILSSDHSIVVQNMYLAYKDGKVLDLGKNRYLNQLVQST